MTGATAIAFAVAGLRVHHPVVIVVFVGCLVALAYAVARMATRPLDDLATAAARLGNDIDASPLPERGPSEVRAAAAAFNAMQARIRRDMRERTSMLAAITHDLQTPVTRLRLRLEKVADDELAPGSRRSLRVPHPRGPRPGPQPRRARAAGARRPRLAARKPLRRRTGSRARRHAPGARPGVSVRCAPNALRRCVMNLLDNALAYGRFARVESAAADGRAVVRIRDGGPGIPNDRLQAVLDPFVRRRDVPLARDGRHGPGSDHRQHRRHPPRRHARTTRPPRGRPRGNAKRAGVALSLCSPQPRLLAWKRLPDWPRVDAVSGPTRPGNCRGASMTLKSSLAADSQLALRSSSGDTPSLRVRHADVTDSRSPRSRWRAS